MIAIDLDGTLVDSVADLHAAVVSMQGSLDRQTATLGNVRDWVGNGIERLVHRALTHSMTDDAAESEFNAALSAFLTAYDHANGKASHLYPGVRSGLDWLATQNIPLVCITNKAGRFSRPLLDALGIDKYFLHHIAGDDVTAKKPHPAALLEAARRTNATPSRCVIIGDSVSDFRAGRAAGFSVVAVSYGYNHGIPVAELTGEERPDAVIDSFDELAKALSSVRQ